jgi:16S rRNA (cytidine1402-2'-O)-methyltransferase
MLIVGGVDIGNRLDIGSRMISAIRESDIVLVENKSMFDSLCKDLSVVPSGSVIEYYAPMDEELEEAIILKVIEALKSNRDVLICPDDGMASIADPGGKIIVIAHEEGLPVEVIPGPSIISALPAILGIGGKSFIFEDDIPGESSDIRIERLVWIKESKMPYLFLVKNRRDDNSKVLEILKDIETVFGKYCQVGIGINVSMANQTIARGSVSKIISKIFDMNIDQSDFISILIAGNRG